MSLSVRQEWAIWVAQWLNRPQAVLRQFYLSSASDPLAARAPNLNNPSSRQMPIDLSGVGDISKLPSIGSIQPPGTSIFSFPIVQVIRPDDMLVAGISFSNLKLVYSPSGSTTISQLISLDSTQLSHIQLRLPAQSIGEDTFPEPGDTLPIPTRARTGGMSNLYFRLPINFAPIPYSLHSILDALRTSTMEVSEQLAVPASATEFARRFHYSATDFNTFSWLEIPYRVILAPGAGTHWAF